MQKTNVQSIHCPISHMASFLSIFWIYADSKHFNGNSVTSSVNENTVRVSSLLASDMTQLLLVYVSVLEVRPGKLVKAYVSSHRHVLKWLL